MLLFLISSLPIYPASPPASHLPIYLHQFLRFIKSFRNNAVGFRQSNQNLELEKLLKFPAFKSCKKSMILQQNSKVQIKKQKKNPTQIHLLEIAFVKISLFISTKLFYACLYFYIYLIAVDSYCARCFVNCFYHYYIVTSFQDNNIQLPNHL